MKIDQFRNIMEQDVDFENKDVVIFGKNGVGKSNLCEVLSRNLINEHYIDGDFERVSDEQKFAVAYVAPNRMYKKGNNETNMGPSLELLENLIINSNEPNYDNLVGSLIDYYYNNFDEYYNKLKKLLNQIYPELDYVDSNDEEKRCIYMLSDGHKSIAYILLLLLVQENIAYNESILRKKKLKKIAIIDEIDLNIHFSIQRNIYRVLKENFPDTAFIISTHSPVFLSAIKENDACIYNLENGRLGLMKNVYTKDIEEIFDTNFGTSMHNNEIEDYLVKLKVEYINFVRNNDKEIINSLKKIQNERAELMSNIYINNYFERLKDEL